MARQVLVYEWECPICGDSKTGLGRDDRPAIERQAENAFRQHLIAGKGAGHGPEGEFPSTIDAAHVLDHIDVRAATSDRSSAKP